jgi:hypothetical protein
MLLRRQHHSFDDVRKRVLSTKAVTPQLMSDVLAACGIGVRDPTPAASRVRYLIEAQAWTDAALTLAEHELPRWTIARLVLEEGEWHCALTKHCQMPDWLDDAIEARHEVLPLAILAALIEAREADVSSTAGTPQTTPRIKAQDIGAAPALCCENFA